MFFYFLSMRDQSNRTYTNTHTHVKNKATKVLLAHNENQNQNDRLSKYRITNIQQTLTQYIFYRLQCSQHEKIIYI